MKVAQGTSVPGQGDPLLLFFLLRPEGGRALQVRPPSGRRSQVDGILAPGFSLRLQCLSMAGRWRACYELP